jgi:hypothetical protein
MKYCLLNSYLKKRRAVSQIMGSLLILGLVTSVGSVILFNGMNQINAFTYDLSFHDKVTNEKFRENIMFEHVRFNPGDNTISLYIANVGTVESTITSVTVVKMDTQEILIYAADVPSTVYVKESIELPPITVPLTTNNPIWDNPTYLNSDYKISITTSKGNFFSTIARPFNT